MAFWYACIMEWIIKASDWESEFDNTYPRILCVQKTATKIMERRLLLLVTFQFYRTAVSSNVVEPCETGSSYTLYFTSPAAGVNSTDVQTCLHKAVVDRREGLFSPLIRPETVFCPSQLWTRVRQVRSMSYDSVARTILLQLASDDDSRFTLVSVHTCPPNIGNISNRTDEHDVTSHEPIQVTIYLTLGYELSLIYFCKTS